MELDYCEIMELPEPMDGADVATLDVVCGVYIHLVCKFTRLIREAQLVKMCWMQQERIALYAKRLAFNQRAHRRAVAQFRKAEMINFCLRVKAWVLCCPKRRLKIRALIGQVRLEKWQDKVLAYRAYKAATPCQNQDVNNDTNLSPSVDQACQIEGRERPCRRSDVGNWYRLPHIPRRVKMGGEIFPRGCGTPNKGGMRRAFPSVVFWPDELAFEHSQNSSPQEDTLKPDFHRGKDLGNTEQGGSNSTRSPTNIAREGPT